MGRESSSSNSLAPGFRFHPTDEELVRYYLKRKVTNRPVRMDPISVVDIYRTEPWDLPGMSKLKTRDLEWYFFSPLDKKYGIGSKTNRATEKGYWKTTGKDREVRCGSRIVGMKKTLVYHFGRAPRGDRTNWVMHEYRLADEQLEKAGIAQDTFVLCRIFQKSGSGPKNGEQYGAPFVEEEWEEDDEDVLVLPAERVSAVVANDKVATIDDLDLDAQLLENFDIDTTSDNNTHPLNFSQGETNNFIQQSLFMNEDGQKRSSNWSGPHVPEFPNEQNMPYLPGQCVVQAESAKYENSTESSNDPNTVDVGYVADSANNVNSVNAGYFFDGPFLDATENLAFTEGFYLESEDLANPLGPDSSGDSPGFDVEDYLNFFDSSDENFTFDISEILGTENDVSVQASMSQKNVHGDAVEVLPTSQNLMQIQGQNGATKQNQETTKFESDIKYPFMKQVSQILGSYPAPPALASEFPIKDVNLRMHQDQSSSSIHVTAGMISIGNVSLVASGMDWSFGKGGIVNFLFSFGLSRNTVTPTSLAPTAATFKTRSFALRGWVFLMFFWVLIVSMSYKMGACIYPN